jgi:uncharacterized membrane protein
MEVLRSLYASPYFSSVHFAFIVIHVTAALISLGVAPVAMAVSKGGTAHRRWGLVYFWGMVTVNSAALLLLTWRFNVFLFGITILTLYQVVTGYRALQRKRPQQLAAPHWFDWSFLLLTLVTGAGLLIWGVATLFGLTNAWIPGGDGLWVVMGLLPLIFGGAILNNVLADLRLMRQPPADRNWWWYYHMERMVGSYIGLLTALMVQQVGPRLPDSYAWIVWVAPTLIGTPLLIRWIAYYRNRFEESRRPVTTEASRVWV